MTPPAIHIKVDPALTDDDSDELVAHKMPGGDLFIEIYQGPGFGTQHTQTTLKPEAINSLVKFIGWRSCMEGLRSTIYSGAMTYAELDNLAHRTAIDCHISNGHIITLSGIILAALQKVSEVERRERGLKSIDRICDTCGGEKDSEGRCAMCLQATLTAAETQLAEARKERDEAVRAIPSRCPITGLPFFMMLGSQHDAAVKIPTYGGPFDSYTIPELEDENKPLHEREFTREHFDHDEGSWDDGCECLTIRLIEEAQLSRLTAEVERLRECLQSMLDAYEELHAKYDLGDCEATIAARAAMSNQEKQ